MIPGCSVRSDIGGFDRVRVLFGGRDDRPRSSACVWWYYSGVIPPMGGRKMMHPRWGFSHSTNLMNKPIVCEYRDWNREANM